MMVSMEEQKVIFDVSNRTEVRYLGLCLYFLINAMSSSCRMNQFSCELLLSNNFTRAVAQLPLPMTAMRVLESMEHMCNCRKVNILPIIKSRNNTLRLGARNECAAEINRILRKDICCTI